MGFEPTTAILEGWHSTVELHPQLVESGGFEPPCCHAFRGAYYANILHLFRPAAEGDLADQIGTLCSRLPSAFPFPKAHPLFALPTLAESGGLRSRCESVTASLLVGSLGFHTLLRA